MAYVLGRYQHVLSENLLEYLANVGIGNDRAQHITSLGYFVDVEQKGNVFFLNSTIGENFFIILGEEYDEPLVKGTKSVGKLDGNIITVTTKLLDGNYTTRVHEFSQDGLVIHLSVNDVHCKRHYKRVI